MESTNINKKMRILAYSPLDLKSNRGTPLRISGMIKALKMNDCDVQHAAFDFPDSKAAGTFKIKDYKFFYPFQLLLQIIDLITLIRKTKPDVLYAHTQWGMFPSVVASKLTGVPVIVDIHSLYLEDLGFPDNALSEKNLQYLFWKKFEDFFVHLCDGIVVVSNPLKEYYSNKNKQIYVVRSGTNTNFFNPNTKPAPEIEDIKGNKIVVMYTGNFSPYQGINLLIDAASDIIHKYKKNFLFVLIGNIESFPDIPKSLKEKKLIPNFNIISNVEYSFVPRYLAASDILVIPRPFTRIAHYAFPYKLVEYMSMGKAIIATDISDHSNLIKDMQTGLLIKPKKEDLVTALLKLNDKQLRNYLGRNARNLVKKEFEWAKVGGELKSILKKFVSDKDSDYMP